jgi:hypothetical protein
MDSHLHKDAIYGLITNMYHRFKKLSREFEVILDSVADLQQSKKRNTHLDKTVQEIVANLEQKGHAQKLANIAESLNELRQDILDAHPESDFSVFIPKVTQIEEKANEHFREFIPALTEQLAAARRYSVEIN